mmetsp:Transcript_11871/g.24040  ORF Transcript_11871/g.24040 Transcript_11871/m.24040 type:complete len:200 (+) Transcript_11871:68-667(+)
MLMFVKIMYGFMLLYFFPIPPSAPPPEQTTSLTLVEEPQRAVRPEGGEAGGRVLGVVFVVVSMRVLHVALEESVEEGHDGAVPADAVDATEEVEPLPLRVALGEVVAGDEDGGVVDVVELDAQGDEGEGPSYGEEGGAVQAGVDEGLAVVADAVGGIHLVLEVEEAQANYPGHPAPDAVQEGDLKAEGEVEADGDHVAG